MPAARPAYVAFDTETTGIATGSRLVEIAGVALSERGRVTSRFSTLVDPDMPIPAGAQAVHGISDAMVADAPSVADAMAEFFHWLPQGVPLIAHNARYDQDIISLACSQAKLPLPDCGLIDTRAMAQTLAATPNNRLETLIDWHELPVVGRAHRAAYDAEAVYHYFCYARRLMQPTITPLCSTWQHPRRLPSPLRALPAAVRSGAAWTFRYVNQRGQSCRPTITPMGFARVSDGIFFHGYHHYHQAIRCYRADGVVG
ncbi:MAG: 3'-5' exonuclease [Planctomycetota bacterium]|nr:MAG: 3'-5' exonuclease [Planctomycetota bacterium]